MIKRFARIFKKGEDVKLPQAWETYKFFISRLMADEPFVLSRWGDGEWESALSLKHEDEVNCDGHQYFVELNRALADILRSNPTYYLGMQELAYNKLMGRKIDKFLRENNIVANWVNADAFHFASADGNLEAFFNALRGKEILIIGPAYLKVIAEMKFDLIEIPTVNVWLRKTDILNKTIDVMRHYDVILLCAGMTSNWFVDQLSQQFDGFIIDVGSLLDPYAGKTTRAYHSHLKI